LKTKHLIKRGDFPEADQTKFRVARGDCTLQGMVRPHEVVSLLYR